MALEEKGNEERAEGEERTLGKGLGFFMQSEGINCRRVIAVGYFAGLDGYVLMKASFLSHVFLWDLCYTFFSVLCIKTF